MSVPLPAFLRDDYFTSFHASDRFSDFVSYDALFSFHCGSPVFHDAEQSSFEAVSYSLTSALPADILLHHPLQAKSASSVLQASPTIAWHSVFLLLNVHCYKSDTLNIPRQISPL